MKHIVKVLFLLIVVVSVFVGCGNGGNSTVISTET